jgi:hypothetical protein
MLSLLIHTEKLAEATRKMANLTADLSNAQEVQKIPTLGSAESKVRPMEKQHKQFDK